MQKILRSPASIRRKAKNGGTFGVALAELTRANNGGLRVPAIVEKIVEHILANGLNMEGIFRINGSTKAVDKMKVKFDRSQDVDLNDAGDIMAVAGLLKLFLRELPDPIMTSVLHEKFIMLQKGFQNRQDSQDYLIQLKNLLKQLPEENRMVLSYLLHFLTKVMDHQEKNKMSSRALAIVFGPNLFRCSEGVAGLQEQAYTNVIVRTMIEEYSMLFAEEAKEIETGSKTIMVKPADEKRSPPVKPISYEAYLKERLGKTFAKKEAEVKDVNSNSVASSKEAKPTAESRQDLVSPSDVSSADERALSPFTLDSDSTVPSPVVSDSAIEVVNRTIKECVSEFLYGTSDENAPVPNPRTKRLQKKQREEALHVLPGHSVNPEDPSKRLQARLGSFDSMESISPPTTPLPAKALSESPAFKLFESRNRQMGPGQQKGSKVMPARPEVKRTDKDLNNTQTPSSRRKGEQSSDRLSTKEDEEDEVFGDELIDKITGERISSLKWNSPRSSTRSKDTSEDSVPTQLTELDLDSVQREAPVLSKLTRGRSQGPKRRTRSRSTSRDRSESDSMPWAPTEVADESAQSQEPEQPALIIASKAKHKLGGTHRVLAEAALAVRRQQAGGIPEKTEPVYENSSVGVNSQSQESRGTQDMDSTPQLITAPKLKHRMPGGMPNLFAEAAVSQRRKQLSQDNDDPSAPQQITPPKPKHKMMGGTANLLAGAAMAAVLKKKGQDEPSQPQRGLEGADDRVDRPLSPGKREAVGESDDKGTHRGRHHHEKRSKHRLEGRQEPESTAKARTKKEKSQQDLSGKWDKKQDDTESPGPKDSRSKKKSQQEKLVNGKEERSRSASPRSPQLPGEEDAATMPSLDLSSLHANKESDEPIPAWNIQHRADWLNNMGQLTIDVKSGPVENMAHLMIDMPPSPPSKQSPNFCSTIEAERKEENPADQAQNIKQLTRQVRNLKRRIRQYEEEYIGQHGHKPSTAEKVAEPEVKKMMRELKKAAKQLKAAKEEGEQDNKPLHSTIPARRRLLREESNNSEASTVDSLRDAMDLAAQWLKEKRKEAGRMDDIFEMSKIEVHDEKVSIQKVLLQLEGKFGRPTSRETKEIMKPLYDRYRNLKRLIAKFELRRTMAEEVGGGSQTDLNTIEEHEETKQFTPKQMGTVHMMYADEDEPCMVTQDVSSWVKGQSRSLEVEDTIQSPVDLSGRADSPLSPDSTANFKNLAESSLSELIKVQNQTLADKKKVRRVLKEYEDNFFRDRGRRVQKEDRGPMEEEYNQYKQIKKQLKLLDALMEKHESQVSTGVT